MNLLKAPQIFYALREREVPHEASLTKDDPSKVILHCKTDLSPIIIIAVKYITEHFNQDFTMETIGNSINTNPIYLSDLFKKETGITLSSFINQYRIYRAKLLLHEPNSRIQDVAYATGFHDQRYFSKVFRKHENMTPNEYKLRYFNQKKDSEQI